MPQVVDSAADSIRGAQRFVDSAASSAGRTAGRVERTAGRMSAEGGQPAPFASTPLTSLPSFTDDKEDVSTLATGSAPLETLGGP